MRSLKKWFSLLGVLVLCGVFLAACTTGDTNQRKKDVATRESSFSRASKMYPVPNVQNFPIRQALVKYTQRQDMLNHPWYIYLLTATGQAIGYYVGQTYPINACDFLSSTENIVYDDHGNILTTAPSLDGIYYGGGGASSQCQVMFFFDAATDAMETFADPYWTASDSPSPAFASAPLLSAGKAPDGASPSPTPDPNAQPTVLPTLNPAQSTNAGG